MILLTARSETEERVAGLDAGADDYLTKPFEMDELEARLRALARRKDLVFSARDRLGGLVFDRSARQLLDGDRPLEIPRKEIADLEHRGHDVRMSDPWTNPKVMGIRYDKATGVIAGGASPSGNSIGYARGW